MNLNERAAAGCERLVEDCQSHHVAHLRDESGARIIDCGVHVRGGCSAGISLAEICLAGLARVMLVPGGGDFADPQVSVRTDHPVLACLASQYAGWQIAGERFFAMGSGPMRAVRGREEIFQSIGGQESAANVVGILESSRLPPADVCQHIAQECGVEAERLTLLVAPTSSLAGTIQVVARSIETALHKMHEIGFDVNRVLSGYGVAPLPPPIADDLAAIGRTNDAILYGGQVTLWVRGEDAEIIELGPRIPSSSSPDHGQTFAEIFERYERDFYKIDPMLFSPAVITLNNAESGNVFRFGRTSPQILTQSFGSP